MRSLAQKGEEELTKKKSPFMKLPTHFRHHYLRRTVPSGSMRQATMRNHLYGKSADKRIPALHCIPTRLSHCTIKERCMIRVVEGEGGVMEGEGHREVADSQTCALG